VVAVGNDELAQGISNQLSEDRDPLDCGNWLGRDMDIQWHIRTAGWKFTRTGIVLKDNDLTFHQPTHADFDFHWRNKNHHERLYHYTVNVISTDGKTSLTLDPAIQNHGDSVDT
jgi:hypothetical protein